MKPNRTTPKKRFPGILLPSLAIAVAILSLASLILLPVHPAHAQVNDPPGTVETLEPPVPTPTPTPTPIPQEWVDNLDQTTGIIAGAVILTIIIIGGTLHTISKNKTPQK